MSRFAVVGNPILHSKSPFLFKEAYRSSHSYLRILASSADDAIKLFYSLNIQGMNVTAPFKNVKLWGEGIKSNEVAFLGFTNTIIRDGDQLKFYNTDIDGIDTDIGNIEGKRCVVVGAGGAAYAAAYSLSRRSADVIIVNRTEKKAEEAARIIGCKYASLNLLDSLIAESVIVVNCVPANLINGSCLKSDQIVIDAIYHNSHIDKRGINYIGGERWLINQGISSYRIFTGEEPNKKAMESVFGKEFEYNSFFLIGKINFGSIIATELSKKLKIRITFHNSDNFTEQLCENSTVIWLFSESEENRWSKDIFFKIASMVINIEHYSKEQLIGIIYGEISKIVSD